MPDIPDNMTNKEAAQLTDDALDMYHGSLPSDTPSERTAAAFGFLVRWGLIPVRPFPANLAGGTDPAPRLKATKIPKPRGEQ
mgnify:CR=1 FL=1